MRRFPLDPNAPHHVMASRSDLHRSLGDIHIGQLLELVVHAGQLLFHIIGRLLRDVEKCAAVFGAAAFAHFRVNGTRHYIARGELHSLRIIFLHETLAQFVSQNSAFAAHRLGDEKSLHSRRPHHSSGMELHKFHIQQFGACAIGERHSVAGVFPRIGRDLIRFANAACGHDNRLGSKHYESSLFTPISECSGDAVPIF